MAVIVGVVVIAPVIVAALGNGNDTVGVIDAVQRSESMSLVSVAIGQMTTHAMRQDEEFARSLVHVELLRWSMPGWRQLPSAVAWSFTASITPTGVVPVHERGHGPGRDHDHGHADDHGHGWPPTSGGLYSVGLAHVAPDTCRHR